MNFSQAARAAAELPSSLSRMMEPKLRLTREAQCGLIPIWLSACSRFAAAIPSRCCNERFARAEGETQAGPRAAAPVARAGETTQAAGQGRRTQGQGGASCHRPSRKDPTAD